MTKTVFGIVDRTTKGVWSRNRWAAPTAIPDLYQTRKNAEKQIESGKIGLMLGRQEWMKKNYPTSYVDYDPVVVEYTLSATNEE